MSVVLFEQSVPSGTSALIESDEEIRHATLALSRLFSQFANVRPRIALRLLHADRHGLRLSSLPHRRFLDLAICYVAVLDSSGSGLATVWITNGHLAMWPHVSEEDLYRAAMENSPKLLPAAVQDICRLLSVLCIGDADGDPREPEAERFPMVVLTNDHKQYGASVVLYPDVLKHLAGDLQEDLVLLPSSVHEMIAVPASVGQRAGVDRVIREINETVVQPEDVLSDHAYYYDRAQDRLLPAAEHAPAESAHANR